MIIKKLRKITYDENDEYDTKNKKHYRKKREYNDIEENVIKTLYISTIIYLPFIIIYETYNNVKNICVNILHHKIHPENTSRK